MPVRTLVNPLRDASAVPPPPGPEPTAFHRALPGYAPTPLRPLPRLAAELGLASVHLKDEGQRLGLPAFKVLGASWAVERLLGEADGERPAVLCAATEGNHGRAVARVASWHGLGARIFVPAGTAEERRRTLSAEGADVVAVDGDYDAAVRAAADDAARPGHRLVADVAFADGDPVPGWVSDGYATLFREADEQAAEPFHLVVVQLGVGALGSAAVRHAAASSAPPAVLGVEPAAAPCVTASLAGGAPVTVPTRATILAGLDCATPSTTAWPAIAAGLAATVTVSDDEALAGVEALSADGVSAGPCGGAGVAGLRVALGDAAVRSALALPEAPRVLLISTEGPLTSWDG